MTGLSTLEDIRAAVKEAGFGKKLPQAFYVQFEGMLYWRDMFHEVLHCQRSEAMRILSKHEDRRKAIAKVREPSGKYAMLATLKGQQPDTWSDGNTLVKFHLDKPVVSFLCYPLFFADPHPALFFSATVDADQQTVRFTDYSQQNNPPILHRKETMISPEHPCYVRFAAQTQAEEAAGLYVKTSRIGRRKGWEALLKAKGVTLEKLYREARAS